MQDVLSLGNRYDDGNINMECNKVLKKAFAEHIRENRGIIMFAQVAYVGQCIMKQSFSMVFRWGSGKGTTHQRETLEEGREEKRNVEPFKK
jgi:hypothetical protein